MAIQQNIIDEINDFINQTPINTIREYELPHYNQTDVLDTVNHLARKYPDIIQDTIEDFSGIVTITITK